jgi:hypothetical protein
MPAIIDSKPKSCFSEKVGASYWKICVSRVTVNNAPGFKTIAPETKAIKPTPLRFQGNIES